MYSLCSLCVLCMFSVCFLYVLSMFSACFFSVLCVFSHCFLCVLCSLCVLYIYIFSFAASANGATNTDRRLRHFNFELLIYIERKRLSLRNQTWNGIRPITAFIFKNIYSPFWGETVAKLHSLREKELERRGMKQQKRSVLGWRRDTFSIPGLMNQLRLNYSKNLTIIKFERNWYIYDINNITVIPLKKIEKR